MSRVKRLLYRGFYLHFTSSQENSSFPAADLLCLWTPHRETDSQPHTRTCSVFHYYSRSVWSILALSVPFSLLGVLISHQPSCFARKKLPRGSPPPVLPSQEWKPAVTSGAPLSFHPTSHDASRIEMNRKRELLAHPLSSAIQACCYAQ